ncbi:28S ribosomal protein S35, mitochondrial [Sebastes umbrosus]|uniref:28S ribosomal protein S35, mitochondrial n=1 Tax=Sebastes umbrosus TaxID=72105 RepID=UPI0018A0D083|nr:28S ribosomal protein S35, mitochondrial [Sebastes umbrosus]XP_037624048.1 28S ribosomal protein S35, mitochondrial [Sebastes umbrosus]
MWKTMAAHRSRMLLSLGRINVSVVGLQTSVSRATYTTGLSVTSNHGNKGFPDRGGRGGFKRARRLPGDPRTEKMTVDQDWTSVYPAAAPFRPSSVPLPVRMGYPVKGGVPPEKKGNLELIKIPNFLHLTPAAIKKHCEALKPFCTEWPSALDTDAKCDERFPVKVESTDYVSAGPSVRNPSARVVQLRVKLSSLNLDEHARKKMLKLVGERYCKATDILTITADSCPLRQQNHDYAMYLLTVLYHESWKTEAWEAEKTVADMEEYSWEDSPSQKNILDMLVRMKVVRDGEGEGEDVREQLLGRNEVQEYKDSVTRLKNEGESESTMLQYKEAVKKVLNL